VRAAIIGKGINTAYTLQASQMLHRTESDFGYQSGVYIDAEIYEFCSARISHRLSRAHPANIRTLPVHNPQERTRHDSALLPQTSRQAGHRKNHRGGG